MKRKGLGLGLVVVIAVGGIFLPAGSPLTGSQGNRPGLGGGWTVAAARLSAGSLSSEAREKLRQPSAAYGRLPLAFEANRGQTDPQVKFLTLTGHHVVFLTPTEAVLVLTTGQGKRKDDVGRASRSPKRPEAHAATVVRMRFAGANPAPQVTGLEALPGTANYFIGNDRAKWHTNVPLYARVHYADVYPGIDLSFYGAAPEAQAGVSGPRSGPQHLEYDFVVRPGADPSTIALEFQGAKALAVTGQGDLVLHMPDGGTVSQPKPVVYQVVNGVRREIASGYVRRTVHQIGFQVGAYDRRQPLVIDPAYLAYSSYLGGSLDESGRGIAVDGWGNAYVTGYTQSTDFPTTPDSVQRDNSSGGVYYDVFVSVLDPTGSFLLYSTYLGGATGNSFGNAIAVDGSGNAYVTGSTSATDFPTAGDVVQPAFCPTPTDPTSCGTEDAFVAKIAPNGNNSTDLVYSTFLGGNRYSIANGIAVGPSGCAYVTGETSSTNFPLNGAEQTVYGGGQSDAFVTKLSADGSNLVYSSYLGGNLDDEGNGIAVFTAGDGSEHAYLAGFTASTNFPTYPNPGAYQTALKGVKDAFVTVFAPDGTTLLYSTYLGGIGGRTYGHSIAVDSSADAYVTGETTSLTFPTTQGAYQTANKGVYDVFVSKIAPNGGGSADLLYSTYLGGTLADHGYGIAVDGSGNAYVTGYTASPDFPTMHGFQGYQGLPTFDDAFVAEIASQGNGAADLVYSSYLGGSMSDYGTGIALDGSGNAYVTGGTYSDDFPTTPDAFQVTSPGFGLGFENGFVAKISQTQPPCNSPCNPTDPPGVGGSGGAPPADPPALPPAPSLPSVP